MSVAAVGAVGVSSLSFATLTPQPVSQVAHATEVARSQQAVLTQLPQGYNPAPQAPATTHPFLNPAIPQIAARSDVTTTLSAAATQAQPVSVAPASTVNQTPTSVSLQSIVNPVPAPIIASPAPLTISPAAISPVATSSIAGASPTPPSPAPATTTATVAAANTQQTPSPSDQVLYGDSGLLVQSYAAATLFSGPQAAPPTYGGLTAPTLPPVAPLAANSPVAAFT